MFQTKTPRGRLPVSSFALARKRAAPAPHSPAASIRSASPRSPMVRSQPGLQAAQAFRGESAVSRAVPAARESGKGITGEPAR